jgi:RNA ligase
MNKKIHYTSIMDHNLLEKMINDGYVSKREHTYIDLFIFNYTPAAVFDRVWNPVTLQCRGLIVDSDGFIVARPFPKFFNLGEHTGDEEFFSWDFTIQEKFDGSLGVLYFDPSDLLATGDIATRGSFNSAQADAAYMILWQKYSNWSHPAPYELTYLFEIISETSRVVVDYDDTEDLVLLGVIDNMTGRSIDLHTLDGPYVWPGPQASTIDLPLHVSAHQVLDHMKAAKGHPGKVEEGYVIKFFNDVQDVRVKVKYEDYISLHRIVTGLSNKFVWESLQLGNTVEDISAMVPDEFHGWLKTCAQGIMSNYNAMRLDIEEEYTDTILHVKTKYDVGPKDSNFRRYFAEYVKQNVLTSCKSGVFMLLDEKADALNSYIWKSIKPPIFERATAFNAEEES